MRKTKWFVAVGIALAAGGLIAFWQVRRAMAEGVPAAEPLYFSGTLEDGGAPVEGARDVTLRVFDVEVGGTAVCATTAAGTAVASGRFRVALADTCATAVHADPELWIEAQVGTTTFPRVKIGAVPYALEADRASDSAGTLEARLAALEAGGLRPCPSGMVLVGDFCIDRYEASVWEHADCTGTHFGIAGIDDYPGSFPNNGNFTVPLYACSVGGVIPSMASWFQAQQACLASGKHLCTNEEWQSGAAGTYDPGAWPDATGSCGTTPPSAGRCNTCSTAMRNTGQAGSVGGGSSDCVSMHGAEDMIGNITEWVAYWAAEEGWNGTMSTWYAAGGSSYGDDGYWHGGPAASPADVGMSGSLLVSDGAAGRREPAGGRRGMGNNHGTVAGVFALDLGAPPAISNTGFRCCRGR